MTARRMSSSVLPFIARVLSLVRIFLSLSLSRRVQLSLRGSLALFAGSLPPGFSLYFSVSLSAPLLISLRLSQEHITSLK